MWLIQLNRNEFENNALFFYHIYNNLGSKFYLAYAEDDKWTKWYDYEWLMEQPQDTKIIPCLSKGFVSIKEFYEIANNRTILDIEIVLDLDSPEQKARYPQMIDIIKRTGYTFYAYKTGGKGKHIHILNPKLRELSPYDRMKQKEWIISLMFGESIKANEKVMIMLEYSNHRKTGKKKEVIEKWIN